MRVSAKAREENGWGGADTLEGESLNSWPVVREKRACPTGRTRFATPSSRWYLSWTRSLSYFEDDVKSRYHHLLFAIIERDRIFHFLIELNVVFQSIQRMILGKEKPFTLDDVFYTMLNEHLPDVSTLIVRKIGKQGISSSSFQEWSGQIQFWTLQTD